MATDPLVRLVPARTDDEDLVHRIVGLTNRVYAAAEAGFWQAGVVRTTPAEVAAAIGAGQIIIATAGARVLGVVRVSVTGTEGTFGMLAVTPEQRGAGIGRRLVEAAEHRARAFGAESMRIEVVMPTGGGSASKAGLGRWYQSLGYDHVGRADVAAHYPDLDEALAIPCHLEIYRVLFHDPSTT